MASLDQFSKRIRNLAEKVEPGASRIKRRIALAVDQLVVLGTPVDEGRARSNWQVNIGAPVFDEIEPYSPGEELGVGESANARGAMAQGQGALSRGVPITADIYISNPVPWIVPLNEGSSSQAPKNFVEAAVAIGTRAGIRREKIF